MRKSKQALLLITFILLFIMSLGTIGVAAEKPADTSTVKAEPLKKIFNDVATTDNNAIFINYLADLKIMSGYPDGSFKAKEGLTRAQAAVVLAKAAGLQTPADSQSGFADVKADHWAAGAIAAAAQAGYLKGYPDGSYQPEEKLTRAQGIALVMRLSKQEKHDELPALKDMPKNHWAAADIATALNAGMIGLSEDQTEVHPEAIMTRGSLARALGTLLTRDPGLYTKTLTGTIKDITGQIKLTRNGTTTTLQNEAPVFKGDTISAGAAAAANLVYPDGSSVLIKENTEFQIKESIGRAYIRQDGTSGIAVDNVNIDLKTGTLFGALATKQETIPENQQAQNGETLLASMDGLGYIAETAKTPPWYQQAEAKKVKMKVDMPYGVAAIRGTFILVTVNQDGSCNVSCLTGDAEVGGKSGGTVPLPGGKSSGINQGGTVALQVPLTEKDKQEFSAVQQWVVNTALQIDQNKEAKVEMVLEIPDQTMSPAQQAQNTLEVVLNALESSGIQLTEQVKNELKEKLITISEQNPVPSSPSGSPGSEEPTVNYINYATVDGTFGPESSGNTQTISKNVIISAPGITLRNMIITKDLTLAAGIGEGDVTLENVQVQGETKILGGGSNSVTVINCDLYTVTVDKDEVRIVATGTTKIGALTLNTGATLEEGDDLTGAGFSSVSTGLTLPAGAKITLSGNFEEVTINAPGLEIEVESGSIAAMSIAPTATGAQLNLLPGASVAALEVSAEANIFGEGTIAVATIKANNVNMTQTPATLTVASGVSGANVGGQTVSGGSTQIVSSIEISGDQSISIPASGATTSTYTAVVKDQNGNPMTGENVTWSLSSPVSGVSIDNTGILTVGSETSAESCTVIATSVSNNSKSGQLQVTLALSPFVPVATTIEVEGDQSISIPASGAATSTYTAVVKDQNGNPITGESVSWSIVEQESLGDTAGIDNEGVLQVSNDTQPGTITLKALLGNLSAEFTVELMLAWQYLGDPGFSGVLLEGSDIGLAVNEDGQVFVGYTENGESEGPVKVAVNEDGSWSISEVAPDYPGKGPLDLELLEDYPLLAWWDGNEPLEVNAMAIRLGEENEESGDWQWNSYPFGLDASIECDGVNAVSLASAYGAPLMAYQEGTDINVMQAFYYQGDGWCWDSIGDGFQGSNPQVKVGDYYGDPVTYLAWQADVNGEQAGTVMKGRYDELEQCWMWTPMPDLTYPLEKFSLDTANENVYLAVKDENGKPVVITCAPFASPDNSQWLPLGGTLVSVSVSESLSLYVEGNGTPYLAFKDMSQEGKATLMKAIYIGSSNGNPQYTWVPLGLPGFSPGTADDLQLYVQGSTVYLAFKDGNQEGKVTVMNYKDPLAAVDFNFLSVDEYDPGEWELSGMDDSMEYSLDGGSNWQMPTGTSELGCLGDEPVISATDDILLRLAAQPEQVLCIDLMPGTDVSEAEADSADNIICGLDAGQFYEIDWGGEGDTNELYQASSGGDICLDEYEVYLEPGEALSIRKPAWGKRFPSEWQEVFVDGLLPTGVTFTLDEVTAGSAGDPGVQEVNMLTFTHGADRDGYLRFTFEDGNIPACSRVIAVYAEETPADVAGAVYDAFNAGFEGYTLGNPSEGVVTFTNNEAMEDLEVEVLMQVCGDPSQCTGIIAIYEENFKTSLYENSLEIYPGFMTEQGYHYTTVQDLIDHIQSSDGSIQTYQVLDEAMNPKLLDADLNGSDSLLVTAEDGVNTFVYEINIAC